MLSTARAQRDAQFSLHPSPEQLWAQVAEGSRLWERRVGDDDFGQVRIGLGSQELATPLVAPDTAPVDDLEPLTAGAMRQFLTTHGTLEGLPMAVSLRAFYHVMVTGEEESARAAARAMVGSLASLHSPEDLVIAVGTGQESAGWWEWAKWLPHAQARGQVDGAGTRRLITTDPLDLQDLLAGLLEGRPRFLGGDNPLLDQPHVVVVLDRQSVPPMSPLASAEGLQGVTIIEVAPGEGSEARAQLSMVVRPDGLRLESGHGLVYEGTPDGLSLEGAEALARQLTPLRMASGGDDDEPLLANLEFTDLLNLGDAAAVDVSRTWRPRTATRWTVLGSAARSAVRRRPPRAVPAPTRPGRGQRAGPSGPRAPRHRHLGPAPPAVPRRPGRTVPATPTGADRAGAGDLRGRSRAGRAARSAKVGLVRLDRDQLPGVLATLPLGGTR